MYTLDISSTLKRFHRGSQIIIWYSSQSDTRLSFFVSRWIQPSFHSSVFIELRVVILNTAVFSNLNVGKIKRI